MAQLIISFMAGVLTVAAPCILPLLPVIVGGSLLSTDNKKSAVRWHRPVIIALSLALSVVAFTLLLKASTALLGIPHIVWQIISGSIVILLGVQYLWPHAWETVSSRTGLFNKSNAVLGKAFQRKGWSGPVVTGAALGPVFSSCSPTYALIVATVLPASFARGLINLTAYAIGMSAILLLVAFFGQALVSKLQWLSNPGGWFKRAVGIVFIIVGLAVLVGLDKNIQSAALERGWYDPVSNLENRLSQ